MGISEGIVLADRYRLTRRLSERETGASWVAVDLETGSDVWVQFTDHGGLARAADLVRDLATAPQASSFHASSLPTVLDTGELRMIVDSRALAALRGGASAYATHVEIVIEFAVVKPLTGRGLPVKILRRALPPAEALGIAATVAGALDALSAAGGSHGWIGSGSIWLVRRGGCLLDAALGLAYPDGSPIEVEQQVTGYFAPERLATGGRNAAVGSGSAATQAADVFALGWMLYEMLIGHAELQAEYERLVAGAGAVTTVELLTLWRSRARMHVAELLEVDSALAALVLECLAENPSQRPGFAAFAERARGVAKAMAGAAVLVTPTARGRAGAVVGAGAGAGAELLALEVAELEGSDTSGTAMANAGIDSELSTGSGSADDAGAAGMEAETVVLAAAGDAGILAAEAFAAEAVGGFGAPASGAAASGTVGSVGSVGVITAAALGAQAALGSSDEVAAMRELARASHRARLAAIGGTAAAVVALGVGVAIGYGVGHSHTTSAVLTATGANVAAPLASASSTGQAAAVVPAPTVTVTVTVTASPAAGAASPFASASPAGSIAANTGTNSPSGASSSPSAAAAPALAAPASAAEAITELNQEIGYAVGSGQISQSTAQQLTSAVATLRSSLGTRSYSNSLSALTSLIRSLAGSGRLPSGTELALESILGYFYAGSGS